MLWTRRCPYLSAPAQQTQLSGEAEATPGHPDKWCCRHLEEKDYKLKKQNQSLGQRGEK